MSNSTDKYVTDPEVYSVYHRISKRVDDIKQLLKEKKQSTVSALADYTNNIIEQFQFQKNRNATFHNVNLNNESTETFASDGEHSDATDYHTPILRMKQDDEQYDDKASEDNNEIMDPQTAELERAIDTQFDEALDRISKNLGKKTQIETEQNATEVVDEDEDDYHQTNSEYEDGDEDEVEAVDESEDNPENDIADNEVDDDDSDQTKESLETEAEAEVEGVEEHLEEASEGDMIPEQEVKEEDNEESCRLDRYAELINSLNDID